MPAVRLRGVAAGQQVLAELPGGFEQEDAAMAACAARGVGVEGLRWFVHAGPQAAPGLVVGYGTPPDHAFAGAVEAFCDAVADTLGGA